MNVFVCIYRSNINNYTFNLKADFDEPLVLEGMYNIQGKIIILPIIGEGKSNLTLGLCTDYRYTYYKQTIQLNQFT